MKEQEPMTKKEHSRSNQRVLLRECLFSCLFIRSFSCRALFFENLKI